MSAAQALSAAQARVFSDAGQQGRPMGAAIFSSDVWVEIGRSLRLSGRELQIVIGVFDDRIESAIAADLGISQHTVHTHVERLHRKLHVANRVQLVLRVVEEFVALTASPDSVLPPICEYRGGGRCALRALG
jgi:DNA-binding CsgD family transcriptional regulator